MLPELDWCVVVVYVAYCHIPLTSRPRNQMQSKNPREQVSRNRRARSKIEVDGYLKILKVLFLLVLL